MGFNSGFKGLNVYRGTGIKLPEREADSSVPSSVQVKNEGSYTFTSAYAFIGCTRTLFYRCTRALRQLSDSFKKASSQTDELQVANTTVNLAVFAINVEIITQPIINIITYKFSALNLDRQRSVLSCKIRSSGSKVNTKKCVLVIGTHSFNILIKF